LWLNPVRRARAHRNESDMAVIRHAYGTSSTAKYLLLVAPDGSCKCSFWIRERDVHRLPRGQFAWDRGGGPAGMEEIMRSGLLNVVAACSAPSACLPVLPQRQRICRKKRNWLIRKGPVWAAWSSSISCSRDKLTALLVKNSKSGHQDPCAEATDKLNLPHRRWSRLWRTPDPDVRAQRGARADSDAPLPPAKARGA
jgi:hypothetical protein